MKSEQCPWCGTTTRGPDSVTWKSLTVRLNPVKVLWMGKEKGPFSPTQARFLAALLAAKGQRVRPTLFRTLVGEDTGWKNVQVTITLLRNRLKEHRVPFSIPPGRKEHGYRIEYIGQ